MHTAAERLYYYSAPATHPSPERGKLESSRRGDDDHGANDPMTC